MSIKQGEMAVDAIVVTRFRDGQGLIALFDQSLPGSIPKTDYFEVEVENGRIMLTPVRMQQADAVRAKLEALGINDQDVLDAVQWARKSQP